MEIVGQPMLELQFSVDKPVAHIAVRLNDVWPDGSVSRITYHLQNLCMRDSREKPTALEPNKRYKMKIKLDDIAWQRAEGPQAPRRHLDQLLPDDVAGARTREAHCLCRPIRHSGARAQKAETEKPVEWSRRSRRPLAPKASASHPTSARPRPSKTGEWTLEIVDDFGSSDQRHGLMISGAGRENYRIMPDDPLSAKMETHWTEERKRGKWQTRTETYGRLRPPDPLDRLGQDRSL